MSQAVCVYEKLAALMYRPGCTALLESQWRDAARPLWQRLADTEQGTLNIDTEQGSFKLERRALQSSTVPAHTALALAPPQCGE